MGFFDAKEKKVTDTSTRQLNPNEFFGGAIQGLGDQFSDIANQDPRNFIAGFNRNQNQGFDQLLNQGNPNLQAAQGALQGGLGFSNPLAQQQGQLGGQAAQAGIQGLQQTAAGGLGTDPSQAIQGALNPAFERFQQDVLPGVAATFSGANRLRGGDDAASNAAARASGAFGRGVADVGAGLALNARQNDFNRQANAQSQLGQLGFGGLAGGGAGARANQGVQQNAIGGLGALNNQQALPGLTQLGIGDQQQQQRQAELNAPFSVGGQVAGIAGPLAGQFGQTAGSETNTHFGPSMFETLAGGALGLGSLFAGGPGGAASAATGLKNFF